MDKKTIAFTIADENNLKYYEMLKNSWNKFHPDIELRLIDGENLNQRLAKDPMFFYRATPIIARELFQEGFETVVKIDADSIITGDISHTWEGDFDMAVVQNSNPREAKVYPVAVWDINPMIYVNCGFVVMKQPQMVEHWYYLCLSNHFDIYQFKEQDLLNILVYYCGYKIEFLDHSHKFHGLASKGYWNQIKLEGEKLILPKSEEWPLTEDKEICIIHFAGGNDSTKGNYRTKFQKDVVKRLDYLTNE